MRSRVRRVAAAAATAACLGLMMPTAAQAASGGGCTGAYPISSCISFSGSNAVGDFYMNATPDGSRCTALWRIESTTTGNSSWRTEALGRTGRFGPRTHPVVTMPYRNGSAVTVVEVYTCSGAFHGRYVSPRVYW
ncbi:hypothetical protein [Micromonospora sp. NPDC002575]|uniref:hypothetical protein n=1 Tax=Micromonospora sp. NPDC002575 TaxID=3364222 RepID=UPI0036C36E9F